MQIAIDFCLVLYIFDFLVLETKDVFLLPVPKIYHTEKGRLLLDT